MTSRDVRDESMRGQIAGATPPRWTASQEAAVAKLAYAAEQPGCVALLCGPAGVGKTMLLGHLARTGIPGVRGIRVCDLGQRQTHHDAIPGPDGAVDVILVDHADRATAAELVAFVESWWARDPGSVIVLAGQGRLLSLCLGDDRLERRVRLRATVPVFTVPESRRLLASVLGGLATACADDVLDAIHEIAGGAPATALRLADMAAVLAAADPDRRLVPDDIEAIHRRLCIRAA